ncbi:MAG: hypothetical protein V3R94_05970, partial [Acidobacteriota bacterium]
MKHSTSRLLSGLLMIVAGGVIELTVIGVIPIDPNLVHAPGWVIALCGLLIMSGGLALLASPSSSIATWTGGMVVISMTLISAWVAVYGSSEQFSGDFPFISRDTNVLISRVVFGCV